MLKNFTELASRYHILNLPSGNATKYIFTKMSPFPKFFGFILDSAFWKTLY
jgi:hypothetical protein